VRYFNLLYWLIGLGLLAAVVSEIEISQVLSQVAQVGWGFAVILAVYFIGFSVDAFTWLMALLKPPLTLMWLIRTWVVRIVGEFFNYVIPAGGMGGEPVKAVLLKKYYAVPYGDSVAAIIVAKTVNMLALVLFLTGGMAFTLASPDLPGSFKVVGGAGLAGVGVATLLFFVVQRAKMFSVAGTWLSGWRIGRRLVGVLHHVHDLEDRFQQFYSGHKRRFFAAVVLAIVAWLMGVVEIYYAMRFLGRPVTVVEAWIIEAVAQMVRTGTFFIPASIGAQEGAFLLVCTAVTGSPQLGAAVAVVRRVRELTWVILGMLLAMMFPLAKSEIAEGVGFGERGP